MKCLKFRYCEVEQFDKEMKLLSSIVSSSKGGISQCSQINVTETSIVLSCK